jgi:hypothetical protein
MIAILPRKGRVMPINIEKKLVFTGDWQATTFKKAFV